jgi:hypothetical protein
MRMFGLIAFFLATGLAAFAEQSLGNRWVVVGIVGKWHTVADKQPIYLGQPLEPGAAYEREPPTAGSGSISLAFGKDEPVTHECEKPGDCSKPFEVPPPPKLTSESRSIREALEEFIHGPKRYVTAVSRDLGGLHDGVVQTSGNGADLAPVLSGLGKGTYWIKIERLQPGQEQALPLRSGPVMLSWDPDRSGSGTLPGLTPGLYRLQITNQQGEATGGDAWALVRTPRDYEKAQSAFQQIVDQTASWREAVPPTGIRAIHRVRLEMLAR